MKYFECILIVFAVTSCATSPTGRSQLALMPDSQMNAMGEQAFADIKKKTPIVRDSRVTNYVDCVALAVAAEAEGADVDRWEVVTFDEKTVNAFALPGGKIGVYRGILKVASSQHQLAAVLGHEVGHVVARHSNERVSSSLAGEFALSVADSMAKNSPHRNGIMAGLGLGLQFGILLPYSRTHESEADEIGLMMMAKAGFNPREAVTLWENMGKDHGGSSPPEFMSTHPSNSTRISNLNSKMGEALAIYQSAQARGKNPNCVYAY